MHSKQLIKEYIITLIFSVSFLVIILYLCIILLSNTTSNFLSDSLISRGYGWKNNESLYAGSELNFKFSNSKGVSFEISTKSKADQGIEILIDNKAYFLPSSINQSKTLSIKVNKNQSHTVTVRHFCTYLYDSCNVTLQRILLDSFAQVSPYRLHRKILSILGDSISTIYGVNNYSQIVAERLGYELHNASIMGSTVARVEGADSASLRYKKDIMDFRSNVIVIFMGTNDVGTNVQLDVFEKNYTKIVSDLTLHSPSIKIFLVGILPRKDRDSSTIYNYNAIIKNIADNNNIQFIDTSDWLSSEDFADAIHPSGEGQKKLGEHFRMILSSHTN